MCNDLTMYDYKWTVTNGRLQMFEINDFNDFYDLFIQN